MRVVITRAEQEAAAMGAAIKNIDCTPIAASMMEIHLAEEPIDLTGYQGVLITSKNAIRALDKVSEEKEFPIFCVGPQSRKAAEELGYTNVKNSFGGYKNLPIFLARETDKAAGPFLFLHGGNIAGSPVQDLGKAGFKIVSRRVYSAGAITTLSDEVKAEFEKTSPPEFVTFMSIRTYKLFRDVMESHGLLPKLKDCIAVCISPAVADFAREIRWKKVYSTDDMSGPSIVKKISEIKKATEAAS